MSATRPARSIEKDRVVYIKDGKECSAICGSIVYAAGMRNRRDEAWSFFGSGGRTSW
jgi:hypothetical protein